MDAAYVGVVGAAIGAAIGFGGQMLLAGQRTHAERSVRVEARRQELYEEMLTFVYNYEQLVWRLVVADTDPATDGQLMALIGSMRARLALHGSEPVRDAFMEWRDAWLRYNERLSDEGADIYALPNDGSRTAPLQALRRRLRDEEIEPRIAELEQRAAAEL